jgi:hypothetical protein
MLNIIELAIAPGMEEFGQKKASMEAQNANNRSQNARNNDLPILTS